MILTGIGDEAGDALDPQIRATKELGWLDRTVRRFEAAGGDCMSFFRG